MVNKYGSHNINVPYPNPCYKEVCYEGITLYSTAQSIAA